LFLHTAILLTLGAIFALITLAHPFASLQWGLSDQLFLSESLPPDQPVVIAAIDDATLETSFVWDTSEDKWISNSEGSGKRLGEWPRSLHAQAIENLSQAGASVIGFDVLFSETSAEDNILRDAMEEAGNIVQPVLGIEGLPSEGEKTFQSFVQPNSILYPVSRATGHANVLPDPDGKVRRLPLMAKDAQGQSYPSLSLAMLSLLYEDYTVQDGEIYLPPRAFRVDNTIIKLDERSIPVDASMSMRINYVGEPGTFTRISYKDVIEGNFDHGSVRHNIVLIGITTTGQSVEMGGDYWLTPISGEKMFGVEVHANAIDTILRGRFITKAGGISTLLIILLLVGITALSLPRLNLRWGGLLAVGLIVLYLVIAVFTFYSKDYILNLIYPPIGLLLIYVASILCRITTEQADKREVKDLFGKYVSPQVAGEILKLSDTETLRLGGEEREVTVLFTDIRGFTQLSEQIPPEGIVNMLNQYFSVIIARILANDGMINKFAGDNIMAVWNAPQSQPEHALLAVRAASESQQAIRDMIQSEPDLPQVQFGFGINTGPAIAGNVGSVGRLEYTVIGDAVNLAARLCGSAPGDEVWISEQTKNLLGGTIPTTELEPHYFKGKTEAVAVYQVEWR